MDTKDDIQDLLERIRNGEQLAAQEFVDEQLPHLVRIVRRRLRRFRILRREFDSEDFTQEILLRFLTQAIYERTFVSVAQVTAYMAGIAAHVVQDKAREYLDAGKRNLRRQKPLPSPATGQEEPIAATPDPAEWALAEDEWLRLLRSMPLGYRRVLELRRAGYTEEQIARFSKVSVTTVRRALRLARDRFERFAEENGLPHASYRASR